MVVETWLGRQPVLQRERDEPLLKARCRDLARFLAETVRFFGGAPAMQGSLRHCPFGLLGLLFSLLALEGELFVDLVCGLVDERAWAEHDLHGMTVSEPAARPVDATLLREC